MPNTQNVTESTNQNLEKSKESQITPIIITVVIVLLVISACVFISYSTLKVMFTL